MRIYFFLGRYRNNSQLRASILYNYKLIVVHEEETIVVVTISIADWTLYLKFKDEFGCINVVQMQITVY